MDYDNYTITSSPFVEVHYVEPDYMKVFDFERFELTWWRRWIGRHWYVSIVVSAIYLVVIFGLQKFMQNRQALSLRNSLTTWNTFLAIFSIIGFTRVIPEFFHVLKEPGFHNSLCVRDYHTASCAFWGWLFMLSKVVELGDTLFIVLRKKKLIFLHWYHHLTVLNYSWIYYEAYEPPFRWFVTINYLIHSIMYSYYAISSRGIKVPKAVSMLITLLQLSQMVVGVGINSYALSMKVKGVECAPDSKSSLTVLSMYFSYLILFGMFFRNAYLKTPIKSKKL